MRILADENFPKPIVDVLRDDGNDVVWARTDCAGWKDSALLTFAETEARVMLTLDKDFWQIAVQRRIPLVRAGVILFRVHPAIPRNIKPLLQVLMATSRDWAGHVSTISADGIQMLAVRSE